MTSKLARFRALPHADQGALLGAVLLLPLCRLGLAVFGFARFEAWLERGTPTSPSAFPIGRANEFGRLVNVAANHTMGRPSCLARSLVLRWMLRRRGMKSELRIGVRLIDGQLDAHAWIECAGTPINEAPEVSSRYAPFAGPMPIRAFANS